MPPGFCDHNDWDQASAAQHREKSAHKGSAAVRMPGWRGVRVVAPQDSVDRALAVCVRVYLR